VAARWQDLRDKLNYKYLLGERGGGRLYWLPLGTTEFFRCRPRLATALARWPRRLSSARAALSPGSGRRRTRALDKPILRRKYLWSFAGSVSKLKPQRVRMMKAMMAHPAWKRYAPSATRVPRRRAAVAGCR